MKRKTAAALFGVIIILTGCVRYYKTGDISKSYNKLDKNIYSAINKVQKDYDNRKVIYDLIIPNIIDKSKAPYPEMISLLESLKKSIEAMKQKHDDITSIRTRFSTLSKNKKRIKSNMPEWKIVESQKSEISKLTQGISSDAKAYKKTADSHNRLLKKHSVTKIKTSDLSKKASDYNNSLTSGVTRLRIRINEARLHLNSAEAKRYPEQKIKSKREILDEMEELLTTIERENFSIQSLIKECEKEAGTQPEIWAGPGMAAHSILIELKKHADLNKKNAARFDKLNKEFSK